MIVFSRNAYKSREDPDELWHSFSLQNLVAAPNQAAEGEHR
jgi:hypothetical protein